jgi:hypothetical protein
MEGSRTALSTIFQTRQRRGSARDACTHAQACFDCHRRRSADEVVQCPCGAAVAVASQEAIAALSGSEARGRQEYEGREFGHLDGGNGQSHGPITVCLEVFMIDAVGEVQQ